MWISNRAAADMLSSVCGAYLVSQSAKVCGRLYVGLRFFKIQIIPYEGEWILC